MTTEDTDTGSPPAADRSPRGLVRRVLDWLLGGLLVLLCLLLVVTVVVPKVMGYVPLTILSGSMEPTYPVGSQVYVEPIESAEEANELIREGSVITYMPRPDDSTLVTHRVVGISYATDGSPRYTTQGDANDTPDKTEVGPTQLRGVVQYHVPYVGYVATSVNQQDKGTLAVILAGCLFVYAAWNILLAVLEHRRRSRAGDTAGDG